MARLLAAVLLSVLMAITASAATIARSSAVASLSVTQVIQSDPSQPGFGRIDFQSDKYSGKTRVLKFVLTITSSGGGEETATEDISHSSGQASVYFTTGTMGNYSAFVQDASGAQISETVSGTLN